MIGRREFIILLGGAAAAWPLVAQAQPKLATIGILVSGNATPALLEGFRSALRAAGLVEGQNIQLEVRSAGGREALLQNSRFSIFAFLAQRTTGACSSPTAPQPRAARLERALAADVESLPYRPGAGEPARGRYFPAITLWITLLDGLTSFMLAIIDDTSKKASQKERSSGDGTRYNGWRALP
jgi:hypothetical protein